MIKSNRAIVSLILRDGLVVKGEQFKNHKYVGEPTNILHIFNDLQVDEISWWILLCLIYGMRRALKL